MEVKKAKISKLNLIFLLIILIFSYFCLKTL